MLYGRDGEQEQLARMVAAAAAGASGALVIHGEAGIGKTALLDHLAAGPGRARVLRTTGVESEAELPFAALHQLLRPALGQVGVLPRPQADALRAALGLGASGGQDRFLIGLAVLTLLSEHAGEDPVLCLVDDAQWVDQASMDALAFAARRLDVEGVVMLFAQREPSRLGLAELRLAGLDEAATTDLLTATRGGADLPAHVREHVVEQARGNPLALIELPQAMTEDQRAGLLGPVPPTPSARVQAVFRAQIERLPEPTREVLLVAAADDTGELALVLEAASATVGDLEPAETSGLLRWTGATLAFRHPLVRTAAYHAAPLARRVAAHQALAEALHGEEHADRRAWHRAAAAIGPDEQAADELERVAERATGRHGMASASAAYERAAQLSADPATRARRLTTAAQAAADGGQFQRAAALVDLVDQATPLPELTAVRAAIEVNRGSPATASRIVIDGVDRVTGVRAEALAPMLTQALHSAHSAGNPALLDAVGTRLLALPTAVGSPLAATAALARLLIGEDHDVNATMRDLTDPALADFATVFATASYGRLIGDHQLAHELAARCVARCRSAGMLRWLATSLHLLAQTQLSLGRHRDALASATEGLQVCQHAGLDHRASYLRATLAALAGLTGDGEQCRELAAQSFDYAQAHGIGIAAANARWALAMLDLATGQPDAAHEQLTAARAALGQHPVLTAFLVPDLVEAAVRAQRTETATETVASYQKWAAAVGQPGATALAARCRALIATDDQAGRHFTAATLDHPFEQARTDLLHGEWLRRRRRRTESRQRLRAALEAFEKLNANPWSERARAELRATGETIDQTTKTGTPLGRLTPQEREVARLAAAGATNKEIAAQLFLSPRTVGHHLYRAFPKLGITSRAQLTEIIT